MSDALCDPVEDCPPETDLGPEDSVSHIASCQGAMTTTSGKLLARHVRLILTAGARNLRAIHARDLAKANAAVAEADAEARLRIGKAKLKAEEKYIALSESSLAMAVSGKHKFRLISVVTSGVSKTIDTRKADLNRKCPSVYFCENGNVATASCQPALAASKAFNYESALGETKPEIERTYRADPGLGPAASSQRRETAVNFVASNTFDFEAYLERQGRNEF